MTTTLTHSSAPPSTAAGVPAARVGYGRIPFARLVRAEWAKATDTRAARWLLALTGLLTVVATLAPLLAPSGIDQTFTGYLGFTAAPLSILLPVVSILTLTSEWSQRTALTTFTQEPRRMRVVGAKIVVAAAMSGMAAIFGGVVTAAGLAAAAASGREVDGGVGVAVIVGFVVFMLFNVFMGVALGALVHNSAVAIAASFALPTLFAGLGQASELISEWFDVSSSLNWLLDGEWSANLPQIAVAATIWVALPLAAGLARTARRDVP